MISEEYGDIYFSAQDGLAETRHVFLAGNGLPDAWVGRRCFTICETGFGTGLNMLAAWKLFEETAAPDAKLDLISVEKYPLSPSQIREALEPWHAELGPYLEKMLRAYPMRVRGFHRIELSARVSLTLVFDDVRRALPDMEARVDAWFLDGFAPAKNPEMWETTLYEQMARLSAHGATYASFTAAGDVRRGLAACNFSVEKRKGFGRKRDMIAGRYEGEGRAPAKTVSRVAVIGGGVAGLSAAWHAKRAGLDVTVYEAASRVASKGSGNILGVVNPKLTARQSPQAEYYTAAYAYALRVLQGFEGIDFSVNGGLHLQVNEDKERRFAGYIENLGWNSEHMRVLDAGAAADVAGVPIGVSCLYYPDAAVVSPVKLCAALAQGIDIKTDHAVTSIEALDADAVIVANAVDVKDLFDVPVQRVRGQVSLLAPTEASKRLRANLSYGGYLTPVADNGAHMCGATFQPWGEDPAVLDEDHGHNVNLLTRSVPSLGAGFEVRGGWTGFRASSRDRLPLIGFHKDAFFSVAHGSHGIISGLLAGALAAQAMTGGPQPVGRFALSALLPDRFANG